MTTVANMAKMWSLWILPDTFNVVSICSCTVNLNHLHLASHQSFCPKRRGPTLAKTQLYLFPKLIDFEMWQFRVIFISNGGFHFRYLTSFPATWRSPISEKRGYGGNYAQKWIPWIVLVISVVLATIIIIDGNVVKQIMCHAFVPEHPREERSDRRL